MLINLLNSRFGMSISYEEFMRSYAVIQNVSIDENLFVNLGVKNNIDLVLWAENAYESGWGCVPYTDGNILTEEKYKALQEQYPDEIASDFANLFANSYSDEVLIQAINTTYGTSIDYEKFLHSYKLVMNLTMNSYMFEDSSTKNCGDLSAWATNAYVAGWGYQNGSIGEVVPELRYRCADNAGLALGYLNYDPAEKSFGSDYEILVFTEKGEVQTMPDVAGLGLFDGNQHGIYVGGGEVVYSSESLGYVTKDLVSNGSWISWCVYDGVDYPDEVVNFGVESEGEDVDSGAD